MQEEQPCLYDPGCTTFLKGALFTFYHFATGSIGGVLLINALYKMMK